MNRALQRLVVLAVCTVAFAAVSLQAKTSLAQTGNWEYVPELGGTLDWDTGLVWGDQKGISTWDGAVAYVSRLSTNTGLPWRLPTVDECQVAAAHGICGAIPSTSTGRVCWTSNAKTKGGAKFTHYAVTFLWLPEFVYLYNNNSLIDSIPVYRAF